MSRSKAADTKRKVAETKARSDANPRGSKGPERLAAMFPMGEQRPGSVPKGTVAGPGSKRAKAAAQNGAKPVARSQPAARKWDLDTLDWGDEEFGRTVAEMNASGLSVKKLTEELGLPAEQGVWRKVSLAMRAYKDTHGIARPGKRTDKPVSAPTGKGKEKAVKPKKNEAATRRVTLTEMTDEEVTAAIEGRWVTYNYSSIAGQDEAFAARVMKYATGRGARRTVTFLDHVSPPGKAEVKAAMEETREPREHADGASRTLYVDQIVSIGRKG